MGNIPKPLLFNPLKHHFGYISEFVSQYDRNPVNLTTDLTVIGNSQTDLYLGALTVEKVCLEILYYINNTLLNDKHIYIKLINKFKGYLTLAISDGSIWVLRQGNHPGRYVHIHPARYSSHTCRITANTLKTLIAANVLYSGSIGLKEINLARSRLLGLQPVKSISPSKGMGKYIELFSSEKFPNRST